MLKPESSSTEYTTMKTSLRSFSFELPARRKSTDSTDGSVDSNVAVGDTDRERRRWKKMRLFSQARHATRPSLTRQDSTQSTATATPPTVMADFLSRETELLGGSFSSPSAGVGGVDDIDLDRAASAFPDIGLDGSGDIPTPAPTSSQVFSDPLSFDDFAEPVKEVRVTGDDEIERFEDQFPDIGEDTPHVKTPAVSLQPTFGIQPTFAPRPQPSAFTSTPILQVPLTDEEEPETIKVWREKQAAEIKARDEVSQSKRQETISKAERSIDQFYEEYNAKKERNIKENKQQEAEYLASFSDSLSAGTTWSRICDYIDLQNSQSKTLARTGAGTTDLGRFKEVLLRLKREGDAAPGAAGY
ncbi:hypothetical protein EW145_g7844 [Phellinidium pouzarii]|uniref:Clathrin light chain n=1 Tax=Phellinidium pouzarii TaxID=167371 RepID=A0A4S4KDE9_9AGAM|nr:hypothetical protein EW145_g7844 [Phellinidium pouzarii]